MSKEREAFELWLDAPDQNYKDQASIYWSAFAAGCKHKTAHYQPLLDAKDAEIATLKALLEQVREVLNKIDKAVAFGQFWNNAGWSDEPPAERGCYGLNLHESTVRELRQSLAAINASTGEK